MINVLSVFGTRPETTKMAPLLHELVGRPEFNPKVCVTGQHREQLDAALKVFGIVPDYDLNIMRHDQTLADVTCAVLRGMEAVFADFRPDIVLVQGDTNTVFSAALAAFYAKIPVGHIEAGLRTYLRYSPFPEEGFRRMVAPLAELHFCPTERNRRYLAQEKITENVYITGNTSLDCVRMLYDPQYIFHEDWLNRLDLSGRRLIYMTAHRRENYDRPFDNIFNAVIDIVEAFADTTVVYPVHLSPAVRSAVERTLSGHNRIILCEPLDPADNINLFARSHLILTDSGGIQEEAPSLNVPVVVLRRDTERDEAVSAGTAILAGTEREDIVRIATKLLTDRAAYDAMAQAQNPYGDGQASRRIADAIVSYFTGK